MGGRSAGPEKYSAGYYLASCGGAEFFRLYGPEVLKPQLAHPLREARLREGIRVLDIGCGRGELLFQARRLGAVGVGVDFSEAALGFAREVSGCPVARCDAKALPFADRSFDRIFFLGIMDHLLAPELERCFAEMARVLRPGGRVLLHTCTNTQYYKRWTYSLRLALAKALGLRAPEPSRSSEDEELHVNEHSCSDIRRFFRRIGWGCSVTPMPNYRYLVRRIYGDPLPEGFPLRPAPAWLAAAYLNFVFLYPLNRVLAREIFAEAWPHEG
jgi:SAM-dependent methyltransferase